MKEMLCLVVWDDFCVTIRFTFENLSKPGFDDFCHLQSQPPRNINMKRNNILMMKNRRKRVTHHDNQTNFLCFLSSRVRMGAGRGKNIEDAFAGQFFISKILKVPSCFCFSEEMEKWVKEATQKTCKQAQGRSCEENANLMIEERKRKKSLTLEGL